MSWVCFACDGNWQVIFLSLSWPMSFSIVHFLSVLLRRGSDRVVWREPGEQPRSTHHTTKIKDWLFVGELSTIWPLSFLWSATNSCAAHRLQGLIYPAVSVPIFFFFLIFTILTLDPTKDVVLVPFIVSWGVCLISLNDPWDRRFHQSA